MDKKITEKFVEKCILDHLAKRGWDYNIKTKGLHEHGCDIVVTDSRNKFKARRFFIECKGKSYAKSARAINSTVWLYALGQIITRLKVIAPYAYKYGLGLPKIGAMVALRRIPWQIAHAKHLCLHIFSVDDDGRVKEYSPQDFRKFNRINN